MPSSAPTLLKALGPSRATTAASTTTKDGSSDLARSCTTPPDSRPCATRQSWSIEHQFFVGSRTASGRLAHGADVDSANRAATTLTLAQASSCTPSSSASPPGVALNGGPSILHGCSIWTSTGAATTSMLPACGRARPWRTTSYHCGFFFYVNEPFFVDYLEIHS